tara:strand:- start:1890 stop:2003 length:114 start_codon:yes stop_codon:yes gene_type:complete
MMQILLFMVYKKKRLINIIISTNPEAISSAMASAQAR